VFSDFWRNAVAFYSIALMRNEVVAIGSRQIDLILPIR
jgi:hypothetical protein